MESESNKITRNRSRATKLSGIGVGQQNYQESESDYKMARSRCRTIRLQRVGLQNYHESESDYKPSRSLTTKLTGVGL